MKRKIVYVCIGVMLLALLTACGNNEATVVNTYDVNDGETMIGYYEMSDGTWKTDDNTYKYRLVITGRLPNAAMDSTYVYLSNIESISFDEAWKAAGLSSNMDDYFDPKDAVCVAIK